MYTVIWCGFDGNQRDIPLKTLEDARLEAAELVKRYDGVHILDPNGNEIIFDVKEV